MADYYTQTAFALRVDAADAEILPEIDDVIDAIQTGFENPEEALAFWASCSERFRQLFPANDPRQPFERFTTLFSDETYPSHGAEITCSTDPANEGGAILDVSGDSVDPYALAGLLRILLPSALPFRFGWAETCSRMRVDSFGGGFVEVSAERIVPLHSLGQDLDRQHLVAVVKDPACGLLFWNNAEGFGPLKTATVFTQREADAVRLPYTGSVAPGWLELPPLGALLGEIA